MAADDKRTIHLYCVKSPGSGTIDPILHSLSMEDNMDLGGGGVDTKSPAHFSGHKVVAMPNSSFGGLSIREVVSSRNVSSKATEKPRSRSAGRLQRSRDIVQDVYDRMGIPYARGRSGPDAFVDPDTATKETETQHPSVSENAGSSVEPSESGKVKPDRFQERYRKAAAALRRGRSAQIESPGEERRARSLSRGRTVASRWPPFRSPDATPTAAQDPQTPDIAAVEATVGLMSPPRRTLTSSPVCMPSSNRSVDGRSLDWKRRSSVSPPHDSPVTNEEKKETTEDASEEETLDKQDAAPVPSVKDRLKAYAGATKVGNRNFQRPVNPQYSVQYAKRDFPPKIDIYQESRRHQEDHTSTTMSTSESDTAEEETRTPVPGSGTPSRAAAVAAETAAEMVRKTSTATIVRKNSFEVTRRNSTEPKTAGSSTSGRPACKSGLANAFLAAIQSPKSQQSSPVATSAPIAVIPVACDDPEVSSVQSSVSGDDLVLSPKQDAGGSTSGQIPAWQDRKRFSNRASITPISSNNGTYSAETIERLIDQRIQVQISELEARFETQIRSLELRMEAKTREQLDAMNQRLDMLMSMMTRMKPTRTDSEEATASSTGR